MKRVAQSMGLLACLLACAGATGPAAAAGGVSRQHVQADLPVAPRQEVVILNASHPAWATPDENSRQIAVVHAERPLTGDPTLLPVLRHRKGWLEVRLPGRRLRGAAPAATGWIRDESVVYFGTPWHIVVDTAARRAMIFDAGRVVRTFSVIVGKPSTPTPHGEFFVEESVRLRAKDAGAPFALATSARSAVLQEFAGGPGQIALHGPQNLSGRLGSAVSHGCVRFSVEAVTWLVLRMGAGTPVTLR